MAYPTQPLRDEHKGLLPQIVQLKITANNVGQIPLENLLSELNSSVDFLFNHLLIHAQAEEKVLYPLIGKILNSEKSTATMSREHVEIEKLSQRLKDLTAHISDHLTPDQENELKEVLFGLHTLVKVHFDNEEEVFLPLIDENLSEVEVKQMYSQMEEVARSLM